MKVKVPVEEFKRSGLRIGSKPFFLGKRAYIEANLALADLRIRLVNAKKNGEKEVELTEADRNALILYGITYARKDTPLAKLRKVLWDLSAERKKPVLGVLPFSGFMNFLEKNLKEVALQLHGILKDEGIAPQDESLFQMSLAAHQDVVPEVSEQTEVDPSLERLKEMFIAAVENTPHYGPKGDVVKFYEEQINSYLKKKRESKGDLTAEEKRELYEKVYESISYSIHAIANMYESLLLKGRSLSSLIIPSEPENPQNVYSASQNFILVLKQVNRVFNPEFRLNSFHIRELVDEVHSAAKVENGFVLLADKTVSSLQEHFNAVMEHLRSTGKFLPAYRLEKSEKERPEEKEGREKRGKPNIGGINL